MTGGQLVGAAAAVLLLLVLAVLAVRVASGPGEPRRGATTLGEAIGQDAEGYKRAERGTPIRFPEDHGPHPDYQLEWWYLTANLRSEDGRRFGVQFTIFRNALAPPDSAEAGVEARGSSNGEVAATDWSTRQLYLAHAAVTDVGSSRFVSAERLSRGGAGLAFARAQPLEVRVENWFLRQTGEATFPLQVRADADAFSFDLDVTPMKPVVLQGEAGYSPKGPAEGQASMYYSFTRLAATGSIRTDDRTFSVEGLAWMDREWSTSFLGPDQVGWDWFSIQLDDGRDLMVFQLRSSNDADSDAESTPWKEGTLVAPDGTAERLDPSEISISAGRRWTSQDTGARYPVEWRIRVPSERLDLLVRAAYDSQELNVSVDYWEGAIDVFGAGDGKRAGSGYLEMTGYTGDRALPGID